jgi:hypothetical protein
MNDIGGFTEEDFCIIFLAFGGMGILVSGILFLIQEHMARREQRAGVQSVIKPGSTAAPKAAFQNVHPLRFTALEGAFRGIAEERDRKLVGKDYPTDHI